MSRINERMIRLLGLQDACDRLIHLAERIPESYSPEWFAASRKLLESMREDQRKLLNKLNSGELKQFVFMNTGDTGFDMEPKRLMEKAEKLISVKLKGKTSDT